MRVLIPMALMMANLIGCAASVEPDAVDAVLELEGDSGLGAELYVQECTSCHEADGMGVNSAPLPDAVSASSDAELVEAILSGPGYMPNFIDTLESQDVADVIAYLNDTWSE